jgi:formate hydrogenlyase subunit 3/multisubunit Na+/H+ antiporter MnhD subunit
MSNKLANTSLLKLGSRFSAVFFIVAVIIKVFLSVITKDFSEYVKTPEFRNYIIVLAVFSVVYGFLMAHFQIKKHKKKQ